MRYFTNKMTSGPERNRMGVLPIHLPAHRPDPSPHLHWDRKLPSESPSQGISPSPRELPCWGLMWQCKGLAPLLLSGQLWRVIPASRTCRGIGWGRCCDYRAISHHPALLPLLPYRYCTQSAPWQTTCSRSPASPGTRLPTLRRWNLQSRKFTPIVYASGLVTVIEIIGWGTSLVAQWLRICLPMQGHGFEPWSVKIPHATERLSPWATTTEPAL